MKSIGKNRFEHAGGADFSADRFSDLFDHCRASGDGGFRGSSNRNDIISISFSFGDGLSVAAVTLVGQSLGSKRRDLAKLYGGICQRLGIAFAALLAVIFVTGGRWIFRLFSDEEAILNFGASLMPLVAVVVFLQISQVIYSGCLRGAGMRYTPCWYR